MRLLQIINISTSNLRTNKMRSFLTILGISVGISSIVFLVSLGYGLQALSVKKIASIEAINTLDISPGKTGEKINNDFINKIKATSGIEKTCPLLSVGINPIIDGKKTDAVGNFVNDDFRKLEGVDTIVGGFFSNSDSDIVVSTALLKALGIKMEDAVGKQADTTVVFVNSDTKEKKEMQMKNKIIGVVQEDSTAFAYLPMSSINSLIDDKTVYNSLKVKITDQNKIQEMKKSIADMGFTVTTIADTISEVDRIFKIIQLVLALFGFVALMVAAIGMFNTMTIALLERTRDIGIMKSVGVKNRDVLMIFLFESSIIATSGGIMGVSLGWLTAKAVNFGMNQLAKSVGGESQTIFAMPLIFAGGIIVFSFFIGLATGFYPAKRASRLNPLDALRYE